MLKKHVARPSNLVVIFCCEARWHFFLWPGFGTPFVQNAQNSMHSFQFEKWPLEKIQLDSDSFEHSISATLGSRISKRRSRSNQDPHIHRTTIRKQKCKSADGRSCVLRTTTTGFDVQAECICVVVQGLRTCQSRAFIRSQHRVQVRMHKLPLLV